MLSHKDSAGSLKFRLTTHSMPTHHATHNSRGVTGHALYHPFASLFLVPVLSPPWDVSCPRSPEYVYVFVAGSDDERRPSRADGQVLHPVRTLEALQLVTCAGDKDV